MAKDYPGTVSDEANEVQLKLAAEQGKAYGQALEHMVSEEADDGGTQQVDDYTVAYAVEEAEGMYMWEDGELVWRNPEDENVHIEIAVADKYDGRFIPYLDVTVTVLDESGNEVGTHAQPFLWHPWLYHYGRNWRVPGDGVYQLKVDITPPAFHRHDKENGRRYARPATVQFDGVEMTTGQKRS